MTSPKINPVLEMKLLIANFIYNLENLDNWNPLIHIQY